jgi:Transglycosylase SLT domain
MKKIAFILVLVVGGFSGQVALQHANSTAEVRQSATPRYRIPNEQRLSERRDQLRAIVKVFARRTSYDRAKQLARICYYTTLNTPFTPVDLAEIALAETGGHRLSGTAVSKRGALGVWQLMPVRARSHGYSPAEMRNDELCATAAVRELAVKLEMARGDLNRAKKLYCGVGPDANAYDVKRKKFRQELLLALPLGDQRDTGEMVPQLASAL